MEKAAELLESTTMKIIEVANAVGYENQGKFAKVFAETYGVSPAGIPTIVQMIQRENTLPKA